jgi:uncharacterized membrane protein YgaE (UPF0421/DUF939 family)
LKPDFIKNELLSFFKLKPSPRSWHIPFLAGLAVGIPLLFGYFLGDIRSALTASLAGLVIIYIPSSSGFIETMMKMFVCSFGMIISYGLGLTFSFNLWIASLVFGIFSAIAYYIARYFNLKPPGSFFFIMMASMAIGLPHHPELIPKRIGIFTIGTLNACLICLIYSTLISKKETKKNLTTFNINPYVNFVESFIIGICMLVSVFIGKFFQLDYPYWIPISSLAVLQGVNQYHIWKRGVHRIIGTTIGLGIAWLIFSYITSPLWICVCIISLQVIVEMLITRHYALAVMFLTPMGILLAETGSATSLDPDYLLKMRLIEILIGSAIGCIGGWFLYNERIRFNSIKHLRRSKVVLKKSFQRDKI